MASRGKKKTTFAKLSRESRLRERRMEKAARKEARRMAGPAETEYFATDPITGESIPVDAITGQPIVADPDAAKEPGTTEPAAATEIDHG